MLFKVAGHVFRLQMKESDPLWGRMDNYAPFRCEGGSPLFTLSLSGTLEEEEKTLIYNGDDEDPTMSRLVIYQTPGGLRVDMSVNQTAPRCAVLNVDSAYSQGRLFIERPGLGKFSIDNALMLMYAFRTAREGTLEMHASVVNCNGTAYMFLGRSGAGKSTHSRLWLENVGGCSLLNDDNPVVRVMPDGEIRAFGSPWSGKTPCYKNESAPVGAVVSIVQAPHNAIRRLSPLEGYAAVYPSCSGLRSEEKMADALHDTISAVALGVPAFELECLPDAAAALTCKKGVENG